MIRPPKVLTISENDYRNLHWPRIREAVAAALIGPWNVTFSSEELYRSVYNICTQRHAPLLYQDLVAVVSTHLREEAGRLFGLSDAEFFPRLNQHLLNFKRSAEIITLGFNYLERVYVGERLQSKLMTTFMGLQQREVFQSPLRARLGVLLPLLSPTSGFDPLVLSAIVKELYAVDPAFNPHLFSLYIPCFTPARSLDQDARDTQAVRQAIAQLRSQGAGASSSIHLKRTLNDAILT